MAATATMAAPGHRGTQPILEMAARPLMVAPVIRVAKAHLAALVFQVTQLSLEMVK